MARHVRPPAPGVRRRFASLIALLIAIAFTIIGTTGAAAPESANVPGPITNKAERDQAFGFFTGTYKSSMPRPEFILDALTPSAPPAGVSGDIIIGPPGPDGMPFPMPGPESAPTPAPPPGLTADDIEKYQQPYRLNVEFGCTFFFISPDGFGSTGAHCADMTDARSSIQQQYRFLVQQDISELRSKSPTLFPPDFEMPKLERIEEEQITDTYEIVQPNIPGAVVTDPLEVVLRAFRYTDRGSDHAIFKLTGAPTVKWLRVASVQPPLETPVTAVGFPGSHIEELDKDPQYAGDEPVEEPMINKLDNANSARVTSTSGTISSFQTREGILAVETDASFDFGMSGGALVNDATQEVVGVISSMQFSMGGNFNYITDVATLSNDMVTEGVMKSLPVEATNWWTTSTLPNWLLVAVGVLALAAIAWLAWLTFFRNRSKQPVRKEVPTATTAAQPEPAT